MNSFPSPKFDLKISKELVNTLYPICRSILGKGYRDSLEILRKHIPLKLLKNKSGENIFDWTIPKEWEINDAYIITPDGKKIANFKKHSLHILNYSIPFSGKVTFDELKKHIYTLPDKPKAIPYVTSYYKKDWGFCIAYNEYKTLPNKGMYEVLIKSKHLNGTLVNGHLLLKGKSKKEIMISTYLCHPQMANHELSGPILMIFLYNYIKSIKNRKYSYRFLVCPENIGSITYLKKFGKYLKKNLEGGLILNLLANGNEYTYKKTRHGNSLIDKIVYNVLSHNSKKFNTLDFFPDGSDERQFSSPGFNLPFGVLMRKNYSDMPEYHTSLDDISFFNQQTLQDSFNMYCKIINALETNFIPKGRVQFGTPQLSKIKDSLYPNTMTFASKPKTDFIRNMLAIINEADGKTSLIDIANKNNFCLIENKELIDRLIKNKLIR